MNDFDEIRGMPTSLRPIEHMKPRDPFEIDIAMASELQGLIIHESLLRSFNILKKVKELLANGTPAGVVMDLIELMETPLPEAEKLEEVSERDEGENHEQYIIGNGIVGLLPDGDGDREGAPD